MGTPVQPRRAALVAVPVGPLRTGVTCPVAHNRRDGPGGSTPGTRRLSINQDFRTSFSVLSRGRPHGVQFGPPPAFSVFRDSAVESGFPIPLGIEARFPGGG